MKLLVTGKERLTQELNDMTTSAFVIEFSAQPSLTNAVHKHLAVKRIAMADLESAHSEAKCMQV